MGDDWKGGDDIANYPGGGFKVNLLKDDLEQYKDRDDLIIMFTDSYDVVLLAEADEILEKFRRFDANIVFGAEGFCWPDVSLKDKYPEIVSGKRFLNSGGFIGFAKDIFAIVNQTDIKDLDDDQLYYTNLYLDKEFRDKHRIKLDHKADIFQNLNGASGEVELAFDDDYPRLLNSMYDTKPIVLHGNGPSKRILNTLTNYIPKAWNVEDQCTACWEDTLVFNDLPEVPHVMVGIFIEKPTPFIEEFFDRVAALDYTKSKISIFIHNAIEYHDKDIDIFLKAHQAKYRDIEVLGAKVGIKEWHARNKGITKCQEVKCDYYFSLDSEAHIDNTQTLKLLIEQNRNVVAPFLLRPYKAWSNFWGALTSEGIFFYIIYYMHSDKKKVPICFGENSQKKIYDFKSL